MRELLLAAALVANVALGQTAEPAPAPPPPSTSLGARFDCLHDFGRDKGGSQDCLTVTGLRLGITHQARPNVVGYLRLDPFATPVGGRGNSPRRAGLPGVDDTELGIIDEYAVTWKARPNLEISAQSYDGAARIPSVSGLALANSLSLTGWQQTAMTVTYNLSALPDMLVKFAVGNGEGEDGRNMDPQQYFGVEAGASVVKGVRVSLGVSLDGNSVGSAEAAFVDRRYEERCGVTPTTDVKLGHSTQRLAAGVELDGTMPGVEGLKAALGWQRNVLSDLDKQRQSAALAEQLQGEDGARNSTCKIDLDSFFVEASDGAAVNTVQQTTYGVSLGYRFMTSYFIGLDYTSRRIDTGSVDAFALCDGYADGVCQTFSSRSLNRLGQDAITAGVGMDLSPDLTLTVEYHESTYDEKYAQVFYPAADDKTSDSLELFNARLAYNW